MTDHSVSSSLILANKNALITGAASGIGLAIAQTFARSGASVQIVDRNFEDASAVARKITEQGGKASAWACDVRDHAGVHQLFGQIASQDRKSVV